MYNKMYPSYNPNIYNHTPGYDDRFFGAFAVPFLLGGLGGAAVVGLSRPRPVYVNPYYNQYPPYYNQYNTYNQYPYGNY